VLGDDDGVDLGTKALSLLLTTIHEHDVGEVEEVLDTLVVLYNFTTKKLNFLMILYNLG